MKTIKNPFVKMLMGIILLIAIIILAQSILPPDIQPLVILLSGGVTIILVSLWIGKLTPEREKNALYTLFAWIVWVILSSVVSNHPIVWAVVVYGGVVVFIIASYFVFFKEKHVTD